MYLSLFLSSYATPLSFPLIPSLPCFSSPQVDAKATPKGKGNKSAATTPASGQRRSTRERKAAAPPSPTEEPSKAKGKRRQSAQGAGKGSHKKSKKEAKQEGELKQYTIQLFWVRK